MTVRYRGMPDQLVAYLQTQSRVQYSLPISVKSQVENTCKQTHLQVWEKV